MINDKYCHFKHICYFLHNEDFTQVHIVSPLAKLEPTWSHQKCYELFQQISGHTDPMKHTNKLR